MNWEVNRSEVIFFLKKVENIFYRCPGAQTERVKFCSGRKSPGTVPLYSSRQKIGYNFLICANFKIINTSKK